MALISLVSSRSEVCGSQSQVRDPQEVFTPSAQGTTMWNVFWSTTDHQGKFQRRKVCRSPKGLGDVSEGSPEITFVREVARNPLLLA